MHTAHSARPGQDRAREEAIRKHENTRALNIAVLGSMPFHELMKSGTAVFPAPPPLSSLTPVSVARLLPGTTHRGRVLRGTIIALPIHSGCPQTLVEDEDGDAVMVSPPLTSFRASLYLLHYPPNVFSDGFNIQ